MYTTKAQVERLSSIQSRRRNLKRSNIAQMDWLFIVLFVAIAIYLIVKEPLFISILGCASIVALSLSHLIQTVPLLENYLGTKLRFWHIVSIIIAITALLNTFIASAHAIFLSGLENFFVQLAEQSSQAGGATNTLDATVIGLIFNLIRGVFLLLVAAAALFAYNQAQQGNDWRPIVTQVGLAFAIVIAIDVVTFIFVGDGTGTVG
jgi:hypothetical protein